MTESMVSADVAIVGGGLVGVVAAMYLAPRFGQVVVLERGPDPRRADGRDGRSLMVVLSARGWRVLSELDLDEEVRAICQPLSGRTGHTASGTTFTPYCRTGEPIWAVERHRLLAVLTNRALRTDGVRISFGETVAEVYPDAPAVVTVSGGHRTRVRSRLLLGCDGARSTVRTALNARAATSDQVGQLPIMYQEVVFADRTLNRASMHYWPAGDALFGAFPVPGTELFSGAVFFPRTGPAPSHAAARSGAARAAQVRSTFSGVADMVPDLQEQLSRKPVAAIPMVRCAQWSWRDRVVLVGDACHAMAPFMGHGMNCGFEDARTLARCVDATTGQADALVEYVAARRENADAIADISYEHYRTMASAGPDATNRAAAMLSARLCELYPRDFVPLYERCSFTEQAYATARRRDQELQELVGGLLDAQGTGIAAASDDVLRRLVAHPSNRRRSMTGAPTAS